MRPGAIGYSRRMRLPSTTPHPAAFRAGSMCSARVSASFMVALFFVCCLHFQEAEPIAGERRRDFGHASAGGRPDERHDAEVIDVLGNDIAAIHFAFGAKL